MKVEDCIVTVERRSIGGCLDLAFVFAREFAGPLCRLWLVCAVPSCVLVWLTASMFGDLLLPISLSVFMIFSALFNALLVSCMGPQVFGVPISVRAAVQAWRKRFSAWLLLTLVTRFFQAITGFCLVLPSVFVTAFSGHIPEVLLLEQAPLNGVVTRLNWLSLGGGYSRNLSRVVTLTGYWAVLSSGLLMIMDVLASVLLKRPLLFSILFEGSSDWVDRFYQLTVDDPTFLTAIQLALWLPYPIIRLAWFFCYLDQRIRNECWDLQLQFRAEAARLEGSTS
jgi:hypothetical protein